MDLIAIALLCQVVGNVGEYIGRANVQTQQLSCQKRYINCWNKKLEEKAHHINVDERKLLAECVLESD